jgi:hypothetical protein
LGGLRLLTIPDDAGDREGEAANDWRTTIKIFQ